MFNLRLCNAAIIRYSQLKFGHMYFCGIDYKYSSPHCCKCNSFGCTAAIRWGNACLRPHSDSLYSGSEHSQFNSPRLVKREAGFPKPRPALIGSNQLWRVDDSPYYREYRDSPAHRPFVKQIIQISNKDNIKGPHYYAFVRGIHIGGLLTGGFPPQWASYAEIDFVSWRHHEVSGVIFQSTV